MAAEPLVIAPSPPARPVRARGVSAPPIVAQLVIGVAIAAVGTFSAVQFRNYLLVLAAVALIVPWYLGVRDRPTRVFIRALGILLAGYAFLGRGLAHAGFAPLYVGEMVLALGVGALVFGRARFVLDAPRALLLAFMAWGALQTIPYYPIYGLNALRDAVTWGYGTFAILVAGLVRPEVLLRAVDRYRGLIVPVAVFVLITVVLPYDLVPPAPGSEVSLVSVKPGDAAVQLSAAAAFMLAGLYTLRPTRIPELVVWLIWLPPAITMAVVNRGGMGALAAAGLAVILVRAPARLLRPLLTVTAILLIVLWVDPHIEIGARRDVSLGQVIENVTSIFSSSEDEALEGTKEYRLRWWGTIVDYTVNGPYFWTGKGFGINLATDDGFQIQDDEGLRAPHNGHFEILARAGVPGLILWILFNGAWAGTVLRAISEAARRELFVWRGILTWLLVFWAAALINATFDPYLQSPQGGIWFWCVVGAGLVAADAVRRGDPELAVTGDGGEVIEPRRLAPARPNPRGRLGVATPVAGRGTPAG